MLRNCLEDGYELVVRYNLAVAISHGDLVCVSTFHNNDVIALWVSVVTVASKGWGTIRAE
jgi:hypothetical protein